MSTEAVECCRQATHNKRDVTNIAGGVTGSTARSANGREQWRDDADAEMMWSGLWPVLDPSTLQLCSLTWPLIAIRIYKICDLECKGILNSIGLDGMARSKSFYLKSRRWTTI